MELGQHVVGLDVLGISGDTELAFLNNNAGVGTDRLLAEMRVTLSNGTNVDVQLDSAETLQHVLDAITNASLNLTATLNAASTKIVLTDSSGGAGLLRVSVSVAPVGADQMWQRLPLISVCSRPDRPPNSLATL